MSLPAASSRRIEYQGGGVRWSSSAADSKTRSPWKHILPASKPAALLGLGVILFAPAQFAIGPWYYRLYDHWPIAAASRREPAFTVRWCLCEGGLEGRGVTQGGRSW